VVPTDDEILASLRSGDSDASMRALVRAYGGGLYGFALKRLDDPGLAEEVVQEVMERVWRNAESFDARRGSLRNWVYEIATNLVIDAHRLRAARPPLARNGGVDVADENRSLEHEVLRWQVRSVMAQLRPEHREVIALLHFEGLKVREAAERLRLPVGTVKSRSFYALENLRLALEEQGLAP
jgi:RNA polymerase sigma-70 factor (ECF subfamily)